MNTRTDFKKFIKLVWLFANDAGVKVSNEQIQVKFEGLEKYSIEQVSKAADKLLHNRVEKWPAIPSIPEFVKTIENDVPKIESKTKAQLQLDIIMKYFKYYGSSCDHEFKNPITQYLMTSRWSFRQIGLMAPDDLKWFRINFVKDFEDMDNQKEELIEYSGEKGTIPVGNLKKLIGDKR